MLDVLAIGAHPDDIEIFAGGSLARFARLGCSIGLLHLTRGEAGTRGTPETRASEAADAGKVLGASYLRILNLGDGRLADDEPCRSAVVAAIRETRPKILLAPWPSDDHPDHAATGKIAKAAWYLAGIRRFAETEKEPHRPSNVWFYQSHEILDVGFVVPLTEADIETKRRSILAYRSQFDESLAGEPRTRISRPEFMKSLEARARVAGAMIEAEFGEPFVSSRPLSLSDPRATM